METTSGNLKHETVMDVTEEQVARVYALALLNATARSADVDAVVDELSSVVNDVLNRFPKFEQTLRSSLVSAEQKEQMLDRVFGKRASRDVLNFLKVLTRHGRLGLIRSAERLAKKLHAERRGMTNVEVRVATPIDDGLRNEILAELKKNLGSVPVLTVKVDPSILAGMVVRIGDRVYDGSVSTHLEKARVAMIDKATEQIEMRPERFVVA